MNANKLDDNCFACGAKVDHDDVNLEIRRNNHVVCCSESYSGVSEAWLDKMGAGYMDADEFAAHVGLTAGQMMQAEDEDYERKKRLYNMMDAGGLLDPEMRRPEPRGGESEIQF